MQILVTKRRLIATTTAVFVFITVFLTGMLYGYHLGFSDGEKRTNGWWIDKKARYYDSGEIKKKRINLKYNHI